MGEPTPPEPALRLLAAFSRRPEAIAWAREAAVEAWGPIALESPVFPFVETDYYQATMGPELGKIFFVFERLYDPAEMVDTKLQTNLWEASIRRANRVAKKPRPLNLDPGYVTAAKLILASTKDYAHRIYLSRGIYAEVTLALSRTGLATIIAGRFPIIAGPTTRNSSLKPATICGPSKAGAAMIPWLVFGAILPSLLIAWAAAWVVRRGAVGWGLVDQPGHRKVHTRTTPLGGGIAIWLGVVMTFAVGQLALWTLSAARTERAPDRGSRSLR